MQQETKATDVECKHACKDKESCGHACCKRHLTPVAQLKSTQRLAEISTLVTECKHTCRDKLACGHQCCKRHLAREAIADLRNLQPNINLQMTAQAGRKPQQASNKHARGQQKPATSALLQVHGKSVSTAKQDPQPSSSEATPSYHFYVYDIESTGLSPAGDRIVEIAMKDTASSLEYSTLVSCAPATVHRGAYQTHGISTRQSHEHGLPFKQVASSLVQFIKENSKSGQISVLVAHNGNVFDNRMLAAEFKRTGLRVPASWQWLDTLPLAKELLPELKRHSQADLRAFLEVAPPMVAHRAAADVAVLAEIMRGLANVAGVAMQGLMTLDCKRKYHGSFQLYADLELKEHKDMQALQT